MGPRRISAALAVLASALVLAAAGVAVAAPAARRGWTPGQESGRGPADAPGTGEGSWTTHPIAPPGGHGHPSDVAEEADATGDSSACPSRHADGSTHEPSGGSTGTEGAAQNPGNPPAGGGVDAAGVPGGVPQTPVVAPAAAASGPAPAAAAAGAPTVLASRDTTVTVNGPTGTGGAAPDIVAAAAVPAPVTVPFSLAGLPQLRSLGEIADSVGDSPSAARALLVSPAGRSPAVFGGLVLAVFLFLVVHRRLDRGDPRLVATRFGPAAARFR